MNKTKREVLEKFTEQQIIFALNKLENTRCVKINTKGSFNQVLQQRMKMPIGCLKGTPDLLVMSRGVPSYWIEVKRAGVGIQSRDQKEFQEICRQCGVSYYICTSKEEALNTIEQERIKHEQR